MYNNTNQISLSIEGQIRLIKKSLASQQSLSDSLSIAGLSYNDLVYRNSYSKRWAGGAPDSLDRLRVDSHDVPFVSFFSGCGGMDMGLEASGFKHVAAFEINELFCMTLRRNRPHWKVFGPPTHGGDVSKTEEITDLLSASIRIPFPGLFVGGPPCQPFSIAANQRFSKSGRNFKRIGFSHEKSGNLLFDFLKLVICFRPKVFLIENVIGLRDLDGGEQLQSAIQELRSCGYKVEEPFILDASNHGVPQQRLRLFVVGSRGKGKFFKPMPSGDVVGCGSVLFDDISRLRNNETRLHNANSISRYMELDYGQRDQLGRVDRLDPTLPSKTVIAGGTNGGGRSHLHPEIPRTLSVRECARLQTFPDDFVFLGSTARQFTQVGNAVPPVLAAKIGTQIHKCYFG